MDPAGTFPDFDTIPVVPSAARAPIIVRNNESPTELSMVFNIDGTDYNGVDRIGHPGYAVPGEGTMYANWAPRTVNLGSGRKAVLAY